MIGKLFAVAVASTLSLSAYAASAVETPERLKTVNCIAPNYPAAWMDDEVQGTVRLAVLVRADGSVKEAKVVESSGRRMLDKASLHATSSCKFDTASLGSESASGWTTLEFKWVVE